MIYLHTLLQHHNNVYMLNKEMVDMDNQGGSIPVQNILLQILVLDLFLVQTEKQFYKQLNLF